MLPQKPETYITSKKKKIGLIIGSGDLAIYCVEKLVNLGHEIVVLRLPCSQIKIRRGIKRIDIRYEKIGEAFSYLKQNSISDIALIGYLERPVIDVLKASQSRKEFYQKLSRLLTKEMEPSLLL